MYSNGLAGNVNTAGTEKNFIKLLNAALISTYTPSAGGVPIGSMTVSRNVEGGVVSPN
jgi:hypothetical protein